MRRLLHLVAPLLACTPAPVLAASDAPVPATLKNTAHHICWISHVVRDGDAALVRFRYPLAVMASGQDGGPDKLFLEARARAEPADGSSSNPYPALRMKVGDSFTTAFGERDSCAAELVRDDAGRPLLSVRTRHQPSDGGAEERAGDRLVALGHTAFERELPNMATSRHFHSYHRDDRMEFLFSVPASLEGFPATQDRLGRINAELVDGLRLTGTGDGRRSLLVPWQVMGRSGDVTSLIAKGRMYRGAGETQDFAIAMVENGRTGEFVTDAADIFDDGMESVRQPYCAFLDIQRLARALQAADAAGVEPQPFDAEDRYLGRWPCPLFGELAIGFAGDPGEPMHRAVLIAPPGVAGPAQERYYMVWLNLTEDVLSHIKPDYRAAFRVAPPGRPAEEEEAMARAIPLLSRR